MTDAREALAAAVATRNAENLRYEATAIALERAHNLHEKTQSDLAAFADLDAEISECHVAAIRDSLVAGDIPVLDRLPKPLADRRNARDAVAERLAAIESAISALEGESESQRKAVSKAAVEVELRAEAVLIEESDALAEKFDETLTIARKLWLDLQSISRIQTSRTAADGAFPAIYGVAPSHRPLRLPERAQAALAEKIDVPKWEFGPGAGVGKETQAKWDSRWRQLLA
jgi:dGTP triphosphohydrolase